VSRSVLFHVQYLLGIGHLQRSLRIAKALTRQGIEVTLVCGGPPVAELMADPAIRVVQLPPVRARDARFELIEAGHFMPTQGPEPLIALLEDFLPK